MNYVISQRVCVLAIYPPREWFDPAQELLMISYTLPVKKTRMLNKTVIYCKMAQERSSGIFVAETTWSGIAVLSHSHRFVQHLNEDKNRRVLIYYDKAVAYSVEQSG